MFYLLLIITTLFISIQIYWLLDMKKHDRYLFEFFQLRRKVIAYIFNSHESLSRTDYIFLRGINDSLGALIAAHKELGTKNSHLCLFDELKDALEIFEKESRKSAASYKKIQNPLAQITKKAS